MTEIIEPIDPQTAYDGSYYTIVGAGGDLTEWINGYEGMLTEPPHRQTNQVVHPDWCSRQRVRAAGPLRGRLQGRLCAARVPARRAQ